MKSTGIYLTFEGTCTEAFSFYKEVFGMDFAMTMSFGDSPMKDAIPQQDREKIMHISLPISKNFDLMGCDYSPAVSKKKHSLGTNTTVTLTTDTKEQADKIFLALSKDGVIHLEIADQFWGAYCGECTDRFGIQWMIDFANPKEGDPAIMLSEAACALREAASITSKQADLLEKLGSSKSLEPQAKKAKTEQTPDNA